MAPQFVVTPHAGYIHIELPPGYELRPESATELTLAMSDAGQRHRQRRVLIEGAVARRTMGMMDSFGTGSLAGSMLAGFRIACCFYGYAPDQQTQFFKDVAHNRGVRIEFFADRDAALRWLGVGSQP